VLDTVTLSRYGVRDMGYAKIFAEILDSTVWRLPDQARLVWMTMLVMANEYGEVRSSVPGLADRARVSLDKCREAIELLSSPDHDSRTDDHEGRRILKIDGGWEIINHDKYRKLMSHEDKKEKAAVRQRRHRERNALSRSVTPSNGLSPDATPNNANNDIRVRSEERREDTDPEAGPATKPQTGPRPNVFGGLSKPQRVKPEHNYNSVARGTVYKVKGS